MTEQPSNPDPAEASPGTPPEAEPEERQAPADWPDNWRELMAGDDEKVLKRLDRFQSPKNVAKSWLSAEHCSTQAGVMPRPPPQSRSASLLALAGSSTSRQT